MNDRVTADEILDVIDRIKLLEQRRSGDVGTCTEAAALAMNMAAVDLSEAARHLTHEEKVAERAALRKEVSP